MERKSLTDYVDADYLADLIATSIDNEYDEESGCFLQASSLLPQGRIEVKVCTWNHANEPSTLEVRRFNVTVTEASE